MIKVRYQVRFNQDWLFTPSMADASVPDAEFEAVTLPHTNKLLPFHYFDADDYSFISTYRKHFVLPEPPAGRQVYLDFDGAMLASTVVVNGHAFPEYRGGYTPFSFDITDYILEDGLNLVTVYLDSRERQDIPPFGNVVDYMTFGGIYRDVYLRMVTPCHIERVFIRPENVLALPRLTIDVAVRNQSDTSLSATLTATVRAMDGGVLGMLDTDFDVNGQTATTVSQHSESLSGVKLWTLDAPHLYDAHFELYIEGQLVDTYNQRFGFREAFFCDDGHFYLNGEPVYLFGLNRHQTYPYIGAAAPERLQRKDADIIKYELACNVVRTSHYPQSPHFLDRCDEIGLLVFEEIPGWQHIGDADWQALILRDVRAMIERDRNHPAIILWGVRVNESPDHDAFYTQTNALAHQIDPTRQTGGVRYFHESNFLEDVFTFNDFSNSIQEPEHVPYLVTEFNGHMFPTKIWDHEERLIEHALRHARVHQRGMSTGGVSGTIAWCAFDYNTHHQFGSGDRICYHGVMDIFRIPKWAGDFYASQVSPAVNVVLQPATIWAMGERDASRIDPLIVFSNCDEIEVFVGKHEYGRHKPNHRDFPTLAHPPFMIPMATGNLTWGADLPNLKIVGYVGGEQVAVREIDARGLPQKLVLSIDDPQLAADGADMTRAVIKLTDRFGNRIPFAANIITVELDGHADLIGPTQLTIMGGQTAVYIKAQHVSGITTLTVKTPGVEPASCTVQLIAAAASAAPEALRNTSDAL